MLEDDLLDTLQEVEDRVRNPTIFQQDGAKIHTARDMMAWFTENNIPVMEYSPNFPDLNPIKYSRKSVKEKLHQGFPNIHKAKEGPDTIRRSLTGALDIV